MLNNDLMGSQVVQQEAFTCKYLTVGLYSGSELLLEQAVLPWHPCQFAIRDEWKLVANIELDHSIHHTAINISLQCQNHINGYWIAILVYMTKQ
jgi:hypothetical protein